MLIIKIFKFKYFFPPRILEQLHLSCLQTPPKRTGFNIYTENTQQQKLSLPYYLASNNFTV